MTEQTLRQQLRDYALQLNSSGLSVGRSGNLSIRCEDGCLITPSGVDYQRLTAADMVRIDLDGHKAEEGLDPSSEWHFHCGLYRSRPDVHAVVHAHPAYCTSLACSHQSIPAFHYMVAVAGGKDIPLAPYALFGTPELSEHVIKALHERQACLLANHGMIAVGTDLPAVFNLALEVETLAQQYCEVLKLGEPKLLSDKQMQVVLDKFSSYGQRV
jgi:L-fuculose-phosphate aldolase